jgi:hypothetical protein
MGKALVKNRIEKLRMSWESNIRLSFSEVGYGDWWWVDLGQNRIQ